MFTSLSANAESKDVNLQLVWYHQFQFAGYYMAKEKGYYAEKGLNVQINEISGDKTPLSQVLSGKADFGLSTSGILLEYNQGKPVVALSAIFQHSPLVFVTRKDSGIDSVEALANKRVMLFHDSHSLELIALLNTYGLLDKIIRKQTSFNVDDLIKGDVDAFNAYLSNEPQILEDKGIEYNIIDPSEYGINFYGDILFTSQRFLKNNPETVEDFRKASLKGWEYAFNHPEETIDVIVKKYSSNSSKAHLRYEANIIRKLSELDLIEIGYMNESRWHQIAKELVSVGLLKPGYTLDGFLYSPPRKLDWKQIMPYGMFAVIIIFALVLWRYRTKIKASNMIREKEFLISLITKSTGAVTLLYSSQNSKVYYISDSYASIFEQPVESIYEDSKSFLKRVHPDDIGLLTEISESKKGAAWEHTYRLLMEDGRIKWVYSQMNPIKNINGYSDCVVGVITEITDFVKLREEKAEHEQALIQQSRTAVVGEQVRAIAHQLKQPLTSFYLILQSLADAELSDEQRKNVDTGEELIKHMSATVEDFRNYFKNDYKKSSFQLADIIAETFKLSQSYLKENNIKYNIKCACDAGHYEFKNTFDAAESKCSYEIVGKPSELKQVILILIQNSKEAFIGNNIRERLIEVAMDMSSRGVIVKFNDNAGGIDGNIVDRLFDKNTTTKVDGTGFGLYMAKLIVHEHFKGSIKVENTPGGAVFTMLFPSKL